MPQFCGGSGHKATARGAYLLKVALHAGSNSLLVRYCLLTESIHVVSAGLLRGSLVERECRGRYRERGKHTSADHCCLQERHSSYRLNTINNAQGIRFATK
jgi:hypothetical protein